MGLRRGIVQAVEMKIGRPLHWIVCLFHLNEIPFKEIFMSLDGCTKSGKEYIGPISKKLNTAHTLPVVNFEKIPLRNMPEFSNVLDEDKISSDQVYLYLIAKVIASGHCSTRFQERQPGPVYAARWFTTASRILRLYISYPRSGRRPPYLPW